eukprot:GHVT01018753.1.p2 GENE.GHVT01018753.1~~GHVT01018753.1.p2  ORF type:complete len:162 (-),score=7.85 GHVT01018753.1:3776-4261(-)
MPCITYRKKSNRPASCKKTQVTGQFEHMASNTNTNIAAKQNSDLDKDPYLEINLTLLKKDPYIEITITLLDMFCVAVESLWFPLLLSFTPPSHRDIQEVDDIGRARVHTLYTHPKLFMQATGKQTCPKKRKTFTFWNRTAVEDKCIQPVSILKSRQPGYRN